MNNTNWNNLKKGLIACLILIVCLVGLDLFGVTNFTSFSSKLGNLNEFGQKMVNYLGLNENSLKPDTTTSSRMSYGRFLDYIEMGWVKQVDFYNNSRYAIVQASSPELGNRPQSIRVEIPIGTSQIIEMLKNYNINFDAHPAQRKSIFFVILSNLLLPLLFIAGFIFFFQNSDNFSPFSSNSGSSPMNLGKSTARFDQNPDTGITFDDIAGIDEAKAEFEEIVSFLSEPERYTIVGAKIPKGVLLIGPPGTGKTLLAKAIANEAKVPFYSVSGSEFVEMFIGIGASRIRDLFQKASENSPCIVFIDEIDAVGRERGAGVGGGNDEREQTLNQLLTEMDGFKENKGVIVVGATNRTDILDGALLRPGRFDRQITVNLPDRAGRIGILKVHARNKKLAEDVSLAKLANRTPGFSGADLANLLNEAAILTTRKNKNIITKDEVNEAIDRIIGGIAGTPIEDTKNKKLVAYHEVGHAIIGTLLEDHDNVEKITLIPRGGARGLTWFAPEDEQSDEFLVTRAQLVARIAAMLGGRVTEEVIFGKPELTTGSSSDLQRATSLARLMVTRYGMSRIGPISLENNSNRRSLFGPRPKQPMSNRVDTEISYILKSAEELAKRVILDNRVVIDLAVERLLDLETISGDEFRKLISEYTIIPLKRDYKSKLTR
jgi:cell division protease FtsH